MKKVYLIISILLLFCMVGINVSANDIFAIQVENAAGYAGENVTVICKTEHNPGIAGMTLTVSYDGDTMSVLSVENGPAIQELTYSKGNLTKNPFSISWLNMSDDQNYKGDGILLEITFQIHDNANPGVYPIELTAVISDAEAQDVACKLYDGFIEVQADSLQETDDKAEETNAESDEFKEEHKELPADTELSDKTEADHENENDKEEILKEFPDGIGFSESVFTYDGTVKITILQGRIPAGSSITYHQNTASEPGMYEVTAVIECEGYRTKTYKTMLIIIDEADLEVNEEANKPDLPPKNSDGEEWENPFTDIKNTDEYYNAVAYVYQANLFKGVSAKEFAPDLTMTRAMFVTVLGRMVNVNVKYYTENRFTDTESNQWYTPYVEWANQNGIVKGYGNEQFGPMKPVTIEQAAAILARYAQYIEKYSQPTKELMGYDDADTVSGWAMEDMKWAVQNGVYVPERKLSGRVRDRHYCRSLP